MLRLLRHNISFLLPYGLLLLAGTYINVAFTQKEIFFWVNSLHTPFQDTFCRYYTYVGDGLFCVVVSVLLALRKRLDGLAMLLSYALSGISVQIMKQLVFTHYQRPWKIWAGTGEIYLVPGFKPYQNNSFPSGHTTTAFCMFLMLTIISRKKNIGPVFLFLALLVAYSRIYLSQHLFMDVYAGSMLGVLFTIGIYYYFYIRNQPLNRPGNWLNKPLFNIKG